MTAPVGAAPAPAQSSYICRFCRQPSDLRSASCPNCGAPIAVQDAVSTSGWLKQPAIKDMARIQFGQSRVQIEGTQVPVADFTLAEHEWIYFSHHSLLWMEPNAFLSNMEMAGGWNRMLAGMPLIMVEGRGPGHIALSDNHAGDIVALPLQHNQRIWVREHRFLTASGNVKYTWNSTNIWFTTGSGDDRETHYPLGMTGDTFWAQDSPGLLLLHSPGNTFIRDLAPGEAILIQPSSLLYADASVSMHLHLEYPQSNGTGWRGYMRSYEHRTVWLRVIGPGRVAVQSIFERPEASEAITDHSPATSQRW
jgi:uncharacterized protein (AIM24 family)